MLDPDILASGKLRKNVFYDKKKKFLMKNERNEFNLEFESSQTVSDSKIFSHQTKTAKKILDDLSKLNIINLMFLNKTQTGKTGTMIKLIHLYINMFDIPIENIAVITGLSSKDWKKQNIDRFPKKLHDNIYHRNDLSKKFTNKFKGKRNVLILIDEVQIASKKNQTIYKVFKELGYLDIDYLYDNDIKIVEITATPNGLLYDLLNWEYGSSKIIGSSGIGYVGLEELFNHDKIKQSKDLSGWNKNMTKFDDNVFDNVTELVLSMRYLLKPRYHLIRVPCGDRSFEVRKNINKIIDDYELNKYFDKSFEYDQYSEYDIRDKMMIPPKKHTIIYVKEKLRCSITIPKTYLGVVYERMPSTVDDGVMNQSLAARCTGYYDPDISVSDINIIIYTNILSIKKWIELWKSNFDSTDINWKSPTTKFSGKLDSKKNTFNHEICKKSDSDKSESIVKEIEPHIEKYILSEFDYDIDKFKKAGINYVKMQIEGNPKFKGKSGIKESCFLTSTTDGYYEHIIRDVKKVYSTDEVYTNRKAGFKKDNPTAIRHHICYSDLSDKTSLEVWIIHY